MVRWVTLFIKILYEFVFYTFVIFLYYMGKLIKRLLSDFFRVEKNTKTPEYTFIIKIIFYCLLISIVVIVVAKLFCSLILLNILRFGQFYGAALLIQSFFSGYLEILVLLVKKFIFFTQILIIEVEYGVETYSVNSIAFIYGCGFAIFICYTIISIKTQEIKNFLTIFALIIFLINFKFFYTYYSSLFLIFDLYDPDYIYFKTGVGDTSDLTILRSELTKMTIPYTNIIKSVLLTTISWLALYIYLDICEKKKNSLDLNN